MEEYLIIQLVGSCFAIYKQSDDTKPKIYKGIASVVKSMTDRKGKSKEKISVLLKGFNPHMEITVDLVSALDEVAAVDFEYEDKVSDDSETTSGDLPVEIQMLGRVSTKLSEGRRKIFHNRCKILARRYGVQN